MANTEQIEAKLCAYIDGELDDAARAEIEQHLIEHPQHRELLAELIAQRQLMRDLPREKAPEDLFESFQTQLERSVLLNADTTSDADKGKRSRWPQMFALAAVLILACGLAAVIVLVVLPDRSRSTSMVMTPPLSPPAGSSTTTNGLLRRDENRPPIGADGIRGEGRARMAASSPLPLASLAPAATQPPTVGKPDIFDENYSGNRQQADAKNIFDNQLDPTIVREIKENQSLPDKSMLLVVASNDPSTTNQQVTNYLAANNIHWQALPEPMPQPLNVAQKNYMMSKSGVPIMEKTTSAPFVQQQNQATTHPTDQATAQASGGQIMQLHSTTSQTLAINNAIDYASQQQNQAPPQMIVVRGLSQRQLAGLNDHIAQAKDNQVKRFICAGTDIQPADQIIEGSVATTQPAPGMLPAAATSPASATKPILDKALTRRLQSDAAAPTTGLGAVAATQPVAAKMPSTHATTLAATSPTSRPLPSVATTQPAGNLNVLICVVPQSPGQPQSPNQQNSQIAPASAPAPSATAPATVPAPPTDPDL